MKVFVSSDHGGFKLKSSLVEYLKHMRFEVYDMGPPAFNPEDDFPVYALPLAKKVSEDPNYRGIVICRNGVGVCMAANKVKGIRCALSWTPTHAASSRNDDNTNVLSLPADFITEDQAKEIARVWLETAFSGDERFVRRINEVENWT